MENEIGCAKDLLDNKDYANGIHIVKLKKKLYRLAESKTYASLCLIARYIGVDIKAHPEHDLLMKELKWHYAYAIIILLHTTKQIVDNPEFDIDALFNFIEPFVQNLK